MHIVSAAEFRRVHVRSWLAARVSRLSPNVVQVDVIVAAADAKGISMVGPLGRLDATPFSG
jgi:hypothetical protein